MMETSRSAALFEEAKRCFPGGVNSPVRAFGSVGGTPRFIVKGKGSRVWDADGNEYVDFALVDTAAMAGHSPDAADAAGRRPRNRIKILR
jgi:glutamate-1-semialdehyde 2,1-aminomutase